MGHYDDIREEREEVELQLTLKRLGLTREQYQAKLEHDDLMRRGRIYHIEEQERQEVLLYYRSKIGLI